MGVQWTWDFTWTHLPTRLPCPFPYNPPRYVLWPRIDQKTCLKSIQASGFEPVVVPMRREGDQLVTDVEVGAAGFVGCWAGHRCGGGLLVLWGESREGACCLNAQLAGSELRHIKLPTSAAQWHPDACCGHGTSLPLVRPCIVSTRQLHVTTDTGHPSRSGAARGGCHRLRCDHNQLLCATGGR